MAAHFGAPISPKSARDRAGAAKKSVGTHPPPCPPKIQHSGILASPLFFFRGVAGLANMPEYWGAGRGVAPTDWGAPLKPRPPLSPFPPSLRRAFAAGVGAVGGWPLGAGASLPPPPPPAPLTPPPLARLPRAVRASVPWRARRPPSLRRFLLVGSPPWGGERFCLGLRYVLMRSALARGYRVSLLYRVFLVGSLPSGQAVHMVTGAVRGPSPVTMRTATPSAPCVGSRFCLGLRYVLLRGHPAAPLGRLAPHARALPPTHFAAGFAAGFCGDFPRAPFGAPCGTLSNTRASVPARWRGYVSSTLS